ncbi:MAG: InlB B-repeat-containing protein [Candidatus Bathyarchaeia archaeon]|jgi:hypothetical protein|nr:hypothetical protein [Candidatus Bathyarchaeota archaeon A05DMB-4]MDH7595559.1 hypothetical protein [Candidatus Bathyarchaeota archaeon]
MNNRDLSRLLSVLVISLLFASATLPALAHLEPDLHCFWASTTPSIDGTMGLGEWSDANTRDFTLEMRKRADGSLDIKLNASLYVKNDYTNLYILVKIKNDTYWATDFANRWKGFAILFDDNHDGVVGAGENGEGVTSWTGSPFYSKNDLYYDDGAGMWDADMNAGKTNDGDLKWTHTNPVPGALGDWTFEMVIPLVGSDGDAYDFAITTLPKTVGFKVWFYDQAKGTDGVYPDDPAVNYNINEVTLGATFGTLIMHPLYYLTIETTAGGTTNPVPGKYAYGYGTIVSVLAIPDAGFTLDHWELDLINVGSANPYFVTMNQNHTLKAVFRFVPPVGGISTSARAYTLPSLVCYGSIFAIFGLTMRVIRRKKK